MSRRPLVFTTSVLEDNFVKRLKGLFQLFSAIIVEIIHWSTMRVLLIDDDPATTDMLEILIQSYPCSVLAANSGEDAITLAQAEKPDLIILDVMMLDMDGLDICKALRKFTSAPILMLSALYTPEMVAKALDSGADDYLSKPVPSQVLFAHIKSLSRRKTQLSQEYATAGANI
jgi:two-component system response regulator MtrA